MTDPEEVLLGFAAAHRLVLATQAQALMGVDAHDVAVLLDGLVNAGLLARVRVIGSGPVGYVTTPAGLAAVGSQQGAPAFELRGLWMVGLAMSRFAVAARWSLTMSASWTRRLRRLSGRVRLVSASEAWRRMTRRGCITPTCC